MAFGRKRDRTRTPEGEDVRADGEPVLTEGSSPHAAPARLDGPGSGTGQVPGPHPPGDSEVWAGSEPVAPAGNTPPPPLLGPGGVARPVAAGSNPFAGSSALPPVGPPSPFGAPGFGQPIPGAVVPVDRAPRALLGVAVLVVLAVVAGGAYLVLRGGRQYPSAWDPRVEPIAQWVAKERKLDFDHPVEVEFLSDADYTAASTDTDPVEADSEDSAAMGDSLAQLRALGLVEGDVDLEDASNTLTDSGTLAYYDPGSKKVYVRGTDLTPDLRVTLAHELTHVSQDQNFGLDRIGDLPEGKATTLRALAEGDATRIEDRYVAEVLTDDERAQYAQDAQDAGDDATETIDAEVPPVLVALFGAPYILGPELVSYLDDTGGDRAIDEALADPPGEEVLFDPTVNGTPQADDAPLEVSAPDGTESIETGEFGPTAWYLMLASRMEPTVALRAANGLAGDGYAVYRRDQKVCVDAQAEGDTETDVAELTDALTAWVAKSPSGAASVESVGGTVRFSSCDPGADAAAAGKVSVDMLQLPVVRTELYRGATSSGATTTQSACFADTILGEVTFDQIASGFLNSPDFAPVAQDAGTTCR